MNATIVRRLILKDWYFQRWTIVTYIAIGAVALFFTATGGEGSFFAGSILLITTLISLGIHLTMVSVVNERAEHTLPFVMSLPISVSDYTTAKILANVLIFLVPWTTLLIGTIGVILWRGAVSDGLVPFAVLLILQILASYCLLLAVALVSESQTWTIVTIVATNLFFQGFMYWVSHTPAIAQHMKSPTVYWSGAAIAVAFAEIAAVVLLLAATYVFQARKKDFI